MIDQKTNILTALGFSAPPAEGANRPVDLIHGSDVQKSYASADAGDIYNTTTGTRGSLPKEGDMYGMGSKAGNKLVISDSPGSAAVQLHHMSGSQVYISPDGSMAISGKGKGVIITAKGDIIISGSRDITLTTSGTLSLNTTGGGSVDINSGGDVNIHAKGQYKVRSGGNIEHFADSNLVETVGKDKSSTVAGERRDTVGGDMRTQVSGKKEIDVGKAFQTRVKEDIFTSTKKRMFSVANESSSMDVAKGALELRAKGNVKLQSQDGGLQLAAAKDSGLHSKAKFTFSSTGDMTFNTKGAGAFKSTGAMTISAKGTATFAALSSVDISAGSQMTVTSSGKLKTSSQGDHTVASGGLFQIHAGGNAQTNKTIVVAGNDPPGTPTTPSDPADPTDPVEPVQEAKIPEPQLPEANTITKEVTSYIDHPEYAANYEGRSLDYFGANEKESEDFEPISRVASNKGAEQFNEGSEVV